MSENETNNELENTVIKTQELKENVSIREDVTVKVEPEETIPVEVCIKEEKDDEEWGVSEEAAEAGLYDGHEVKQELVIGEESVQPKIEFVGGQSEIIKKIEALQADVNHVKESLASLQQQQNINTIKIITMLENMNKRFQMAPEIREPARSAPDDDNDILKKYTLPLDNITMLKDLDSDLSQEKHFKSMVKHFSSFHGAEGQGRGEILGKKLAEQIMTRDLMTKMSWTGVSRTAELQRKFAFQTLENIVKLFHYVLLKADSRWSNYKNEKLFSGALLKHAKKRAIAEKEMTEKKKKMFEVGYNLTRIDNCTGTPSNISATGAQGKLPTPSEIFAPEARESSVDVDAE